MADDPLQKAGTSDEATKVSPRASESVAVVADENPSSEEEAKKVEFDENPSSEEEAKKVEFSEDEETLIVRMHSLVGDRWPLIAGRIPGRSAEEIEKYWNSKHSTNQSK